MAVKRIKPSKEALLEEYKLCESIIQHLDRINASYQSIFLAGSLAAVGFALQNKPSFGKLLAVTIISFVVLVGLLVLIRRSKGKQKACYCRMNEIDDILGLELQHRLQNVSGETQLTIYTVAIAVYLIILVCITIAEYVGFAVIRSLIGL